MKKVFSESDVKFYTDKIFLDMFYEEGISRDDLEKAICESYSSDNCKYEKISDIPLELKIEAVTDTCELSGLEYESYNDILNYFFNKYNE